MTSKIYKKKNFLEGVAMLKAHQLTVGDAIALSNGKIFWIDDIVSEFLNDEITKLYHDDDDEDIKIKIGHSIHKFYDENENEIYGIPDEAEFITYRLVHSDLIRYICIAESKFKTNIIFDGIYTKREDADNIAKKNKDIGMRVYRLVEDNL